MKRIVKYFILIGISLAILIPTSIQLFHANRGESESIGEFQHGSLKNAYLLPRKGTNFKYYSLFSYYVLGRAYVHSKVYRTVLDTYSEMELRLPGREFRIMESSRRNGGSMPPHRTHQIGLSADFMTPLLKNNEYKYYDGLGIFRYALNFDQDGVSTMNKEVKIDFNTMTIHVLALENNARKNGLKIKKVIFNIGLKDKLFKTENGKLLEASGIYFARNLTTTLNKLHDDHYHVDFEVLK